MLLSPDDAQQFFRLHRSLMHFVNQQLDVVPNIADPIEFSELPPQQRLKVRTALLNNMGLIETFTKVNLATFEADELAIVRSWHQSVVGKFYIFRQLKNYMVFLSFDDPPVAYGVVAITEPFEDVIGPHLPLLVETALLPFKGRIVYDGLLSSHNVSFGSGVKRSLNDDYRQAKQRQGIVTRLPIESTPTSVITSAKPPKQKAKKKTPGSKEVTQVLQTIVGLTDEFCRMHLNDEYSQLCRKLAEKLSRKRPSPLLRGQPKTWACGIIRTIGLVNFLDDSTNQPHLKLTAIDKALGVGNSTGQGKSMEIRKLFKIRQFDLNWTLPSQLENNPMGWMLNVNGLTIDARQAPREIQEVAFERGLIPYIPADRENDSAKPDVERRDVSSVEQLFQFKVALKDSEPVIWRRIQVSNCTLDQLHGHIQTAMGWTNSHLHQFEIDGQRYANPNLLGGGFIDFECTDSASTKISEIVPSDGSQFQFSYEYDFGDGWRHEVLFEGNPPTERRRKYPCCLDGARACPPEDVGGVWGYAEFLQALADPSHDQHDEFLDWIGPFDPDAFDVARTTREMRKGPFAVG